ncbi:tRNA uridine-5-carboxymethylaminomethyl(34) synthesis GTPase MnmE [Falsiroseomonas bella]|uniref:tRNA modification GTPase MnmE n=1 Tax=Falsiroseomonas bella TaxID=2184016 RepID=A0A317FHK1_9PROT|nr:tRNA uridine-5-carboxymethylaminomethyl(34) synthesis GTPase MnmE [Falsiroseomonas bella]PWS38561.1 tRNA uridine-5-carboxymethylaminomethyl(34) synthesis GTPase MnmE [Falsiroseomonas bella]
MTDLQDTIFARASGAGGAAIAVVRLSGPRTGDVLRKLTGALPQARLASLRALRDPQTEEVLDRALLLWFPGPASFTGEDSAELHLHGGPAVVADVAEALVGLGCRPAEGGEFTRRAFLHGKLDLTQAEAVADLVAAETSAQRRQALRQADGALGQLYAAWTARASRMLAHQEAAIEFTMDDLPTDLDRTARRMAAELAAEIAQHLDDGRRGEKLREGLSVAIVGPPNAGKSSLLNALSGREAAIVSAQPGTTRDVVECRLLLGGVPVTLADTAGLRASADEIEREGVRRARRRAQEADVLIAALPADSAPDAQTLALVAGRQDALLVATKCDLAEPPAEITGRSVLPTSARMGTGLAELTAELTRRAEQQAGATDAPLITRARHRAALHEARDLLMEAQAARQPELAAEAYRGVVRALGRLTGHVGVEDVLDIVFGDFCIGK